MRRITRTRLLSALLAWIMLLSLAVPAMAEDSAVASTMQLMKTTGTVSVTNNRGKDVKIFDKMRLYNGYKIATGEASYSWINLDSVKLVKEDACSELQIQKSGKKLDILINSGTLYFNVTEPLEDDESLNIRTSTMSVGIRGTCGWVQVVDKWTVQVYLLEGVSEISVTDPVTGQVKTAEITGGDMAECVVYPQDQAGDKCDILMRQYTEDDIRGFILVDLVYDEPLCEDIYEDSGLDILPLRDEAEDRLKQDEEEMRKKWEEIEGELENQESGVSEDSVWPENVPDKNDLSPTPDPAPDPAPITPPAVPTERTMKITDDEAQEMLDGANAVRVLPNPSPAGPLDNVLEVDSGLTVPAGKSLTLQSGIDTDVQASQNLQVDGTMRMEGGNLSNSGNTTVTSSNTLYIVGNLTNLNQMTVTATGRVVVDGTFTNNGLLLPIPGAVIQARSFVMTSPVAEWDVSAEVDSEGYFRLEYTPPEPETYTVTFDANGGIVTPAFDTTDTDGRLASLPTPTRDGFTFDGWFTAAEGGTSVSLDMVYTEDTTIYAHWTEDDEEPVLPETYIITFDYNDGSGTTTTDTTDTDGRLASLPTLTREGFTFDGWFTAMEGGTSVSLDTAYTEDTTIYAHWKAAYTITFDANGGTVDGTATTTAITDGDGKLASLPTPTRTVRGTENVAFNGWYDADDNVVNENTVFEADGTVIAHWAVDWDYDEATNTLIIIGNGPMTDYSNSDSVPWSDISSDISAVEIEDSVTSIGDYAFYGSSNLTSVEIPDGVTSIGNYALRDCSSLTSVTIPDGVTSIGWYAFYGCSGLTDMTIPDSVTYIGDNAFRGCSGLTSVTISDSVTSIALQAFDGCSSLTSVTIPDGVTSIGRYAFRNCSSLTSITIPDGVTSIGDYTFYNCSGLTSAEIPAGVTSIGSYAFYGCRSLTSVEIPVGVTSISNYTFYSCSGLTSITIPDGITSIGNAAFSGCSGLTSVTIPDSVTSIGGYAFSRCNGLTSVTIPNSVTSIGVEAFYNCSSLESVMIPSSVTSIGTDAFSYCSNLATISVDAGNLYYTSSENVLFNKDMTELLCYPARLNGGYTIPDSVTNIGSLAFYRCIGLTNVTLPDGVTSIGRSAFNGCSSLTSMTLPASVTSIGEYAFHECSGLTSVTIPAGVTSIDRWTFGECSSLTNVTIPVSVTSIGTDAFYGCSHLTDVYYGGTEEQWNSIEFGDYVSLDNATIHYESSAPEVQSFSIFSNSPPPTYTDVSPDAWYAEAVAYCTANGLMGGSGDGTFSPDAPMTRAMLAAVLYRAAGSPAVSGSSGFSDVEPGSWSDAPIAWAVRAELMNGYGGGVFGGEDVVTREQFAAVLWRWRGSPEAEAEAFADADKVSGWAAGAVDWARSSGMISGVGGNRFDPQGETTRAQAAMLLMNYNQKFGAASTAVRSAMDVMCEPSGILAMEDGSLLVTDTYHKMIWRVTDGVSTVYAGGETVADPYGKPIGGYNDAAPEESYFREPWAVAPFRDGWAVSDAANSAVRLITPEQTRTVNGKAEGKLRLAALGVAFDRPTGLASDEEGNLYVADTDAGAIRKITPGEGIVTTVASGLAEPMGLCWWDGALYAAETGASRIIRIENGNVTVVAGGKEGYEDGPADRAAFCAPEGLTVGPDGTIYVADTGNNAVRRILGGEVTTLAVREKFRADGYPISPRGLLVRGDTLYVCDNFGRKVLILSLG